MRLRKHRNGLRRVILPIAIPGIVAGSIFAFSLTIGDYIAPDLVGDTEFIGNVIYQSVGIANNIPPAAIAAGNTPNLMVFAPEICDAGHDIL